MFSASNSCIFKSGADILVNPVNCVGVMGKGLAAEFKKRFPKDFAVYADLCARKELTTGHGAMTQEHGQKIYHFPTKYHWRDKSTIAGIERGLCDLRLLLAHNGMESRSLAIPALGCGLGGLDWDNILDLIQIAFADYPGKVTTFCPEGVRRNGAACR